MSFLHLLPYKHLNVQCKMLDNMLLERRYVSRRMCFREREFRITPNLAD